MVHGISRKDKELDLEASLPGSLQTILLAALVTRTAGDSFTHSSWILTKNPIPASTAPVPTVSSGWRKGDRKQLQ